jgi:hypothetical protein
MALPPNILGGAKAGTAALSTRREGRIDFHAGSGRLGTEGESHFEKRLTD